MKSGLAIVVSGLLASAAMSAHAESPPASAGAAPKPAPGARPRDVVTNPDWVAKPTGDQLADAYPPEAADAQVEGRTEVVCRVDIEGRLYDCIVALEVPQGWGFGLATLDVTPEFRMTPKRVNGQPVDGGKVRIPLGWHLPAQPQLELKTPTPEDIELARRITAQLGKGTPFAAVMNNFYGMAVVPALERLDPDRAALVRASWKQAYDQIAPSLGDRWAQSLAKIYSHEELKDIAAFFESSSGQAFVKRSPQVWRVAMASSKDVVRQFVDGWRTSYCGQAACGETELKMFTSLSEDVDALPSND